MMKDKRETAREAYRTAALISDFVDGQIENFLKKYGSQYPIVESDEPPKGSASFYLGEPKKGSDVETDMQRWTRENRTVSRDVIGKLD